MNNIEKYINKVHCTDCLTLLKELPDNCVDLILTDIPYGGVNRTSNGLRNLDKGDADVLTFDLDKFINESIRICKGSGYVFCGWEQISEIIKILRKHKLSNRLCCWDKTNPSPMNGDKIWLSGSEYCVYWKNKNSTFNEHCKNGVWRFPCGKSKVHPTEKPLKLFEYLISVSSNKNDVVVDFCLGSGTTAVACERLRRQWIGCDISQEYCKIANERIKEEQAQGKFDI